MDAMDKVMRGVILQVWIRAGDRVNVAYLLYHMDGKGGTRDAGCRCHVFSTQKYLPMVSTVVPL